MYGAAYFLTIAALLILLVYYIFIRKIHSLHPKIAVVFSVSAMVLFSCSFILEAILFFRYGLGLEASLLRSAVSRPLFYLGFIGLSAYFLYPPQVTKQ